MTSVEYIEAPTEYAATEPSVFLAGGITNCPDWQAEARELLDDLPIAVLNPRRLDFPIHDPAAAVAQIDWEYRHLKRADVVLFWFPVWLQLEHVRPEVHVYSQLAYTVREARRLLAALEDRPKLEG